MAEYPRVWMRHFLLIWFQNPFLKHRQVSVDPGVTQLKSLMFAARNPVILQLFFPWILGIIIWMVILLKWIGIHQK